MNTLHAAMRGIVGAMLAPFMAMPPWVGLVVISAVTGVLAALAYRYTSNQAALRRVADQTRAAILALRLFNDDMLVTLKAQGALLKAAFMRLVHSMPPLIVLLIPFVLLLGHLAMYYEFAPFSPGATDDLAKAPLVRMQVAPDSWNKLSDVQLNAPDGVTVVGPMRESPRTSEDGAIANGVILWRLQADHELPKSATLSWQVDGQTIEKQFVVSNKTDRLQFVSPKRTGGPFIWSALDSLLYPGEPAFAPSSPIQSISINYPSQAEPFLGVPVWLWIFLVVSILAALAAKPLLGVQF